jgi:hypothetical protein
MRRVAITYGALFFCEQTDRDGGGIPILVASTGGGTAELSIADVVEIGEQLLAWARAKTREVTA